jgi:hypothetical protein
MNISIFVYDRMYVDLDSDNVADLQETLSIIRNSDMCTYVLHQHYQKCEDLVEIQICIFMFFINITSHY